jgi:class 3 adenylate cyclase/putative methionine-R-sulfoxide reductase with GAF domain
LHDQPDIGEQAGLRMELDRAHQREAAMREILSVISQSRDDVQPVLKTIARNAGLLCDAPDVGLHLINEARTHSRLVCVWGPDQDVFPVGMEFDLSDTRSMAIAMREARTMQVRDFTQHPLYLARDPIAVRKVEEEGVRTFLSVPLVKDGVALGCINLNRYEVKPFTDAEITLLETFAEQAVIAIENARQFRDLQTRLEREAATREILYVISQSRADEQPVFEAILRNAARLLDSPAGGGLHLLNAVRTHSRLLGSWGDDSGTFPIGTEFKLAGPLPQSVAMREARIVHTPDIKQSLIYLSGNVDMVKKADIDGVGTFLCVPLVKDGVAIGCFNLNRYDVKPYTEAEIALVETFAQQAVIAIENVRQFKALETLNTELENRVAKQVGEIERMGRLKRFLPAAVADAVVSSGSDKLLTSHRALLGVLFCDIRGFTAFCEMAEPEETIEVLQSYHEEMGALIAEHGAGVDTRAGDGIMVLFNDPLPCDNPAGQALRLGLAMRSRMQELGKTWRRYGHKLGFGVGISLGFATVGMVGAAGRYDYTASGTAVNLAARLCDKAADGEILLSPRAYAAVEEEFAAEAIGEISLKGIHAPVEVFRISSET